MTNSVQGGLPFDGDILMAKNCSANKVVIDVSPLSAIDVSPPSVIVVSDRFKSMLRGKDRPGDSGQPMSAPIWLDRDLFDKGRKFYKNYFFCISFASLISLMYMFSLDWLLKPLIFTGRSDTKEKSFRRYLSTLTHLKAWYEGDVWDPDDAAHKDIKGVRAIHKHVAVNANVKKHKEVDEANVRDRGHEESTCPMYRNIRYDIQSKGNVVVLEGGSAPILYLSQWDMAFTQYAFVGIIVSHPHSMGAWHVKDEELEALIHFWRGIGWLLGIEDEFNLCSGNLSETRLLCSEMERFVITPELATADWNFEHMSKCLIDGVNMMVPGLSFPALMRYGTECVLGLALPSFSAAMTKKETLQYRLMRFHFGTFCKIPGSIRFLNYLIILAHKYGHGKFPLRFYKLMSLFTADHPSNFKRSSN